MNMSTIFVHQKIFGFYKLLRKIHSANTTSSLHIHFFSFIIINLFAGYKLIHIHKIRVWLKSKEIIKNKA